MYWYASDYCDVFLADRIEEQISPDCGVFVPMLAKTDVSDERFIFRTGEWITDYEIQTMRHLNSLPEETIQKMADTYTEGFRRGFILGGKDLSKKKTVKMCIRDSSYTSTEIHLCTGWISCKRALVWIFAVSYTHLDVYKRQVSPLSVCLKTGEVSGRNWHDIKKIFINSYIFLH